MDSIGSIFKSASRFFSGTALSRLSGALRDIAMAFAFGTKETVAAFFVAIRLAHLLRRLLGEGALQTAFIPRFEKLRHDSPERAARFFTSLSATLALTLFLIICGFEAVCYGIFKSSFLSAGNREILYLTACMMPSLFFICLWGLNCSLLQCEKSYFLPSAAPIAFNAVWVAGALLIWMSSPPYPMGWLALVIVIASIVQWAVTLPKTMKALSQWGSLKQSLLPSLANTDIRAFMKPLFLGMLGVAAAQINSALDPLFARYADEEGPAFLWYAIRIQQAPLALFGIALSSALLPPLSRAIEKKEHAASQLFFRYAFRRSLLIMVPVTLLLFLLGKTGITWVYGRGSFSSESIAGTTACLQGYALGLLPMTLVLIYAPAFYARGNYLIPSLSSSLSVILNMSLNALFILGLGWGAASVAYATSLSAWFNCALLAAILYRTERMSSPPSFVGR